MIYPLSQPEPWKRRELTQRDGRNSGKSMGTKSHLAIRRMISIAVSSMPASEKVVCDHKRGEWASFNVDHHCPPPGSYSDCYPHYDQGQQEKYRAKHALGVTRNLKATKASYSAKRPFFIQRNLNKRDRQGYMGVVFPFDWDI